MLNNILGIRDSGKNYSEILFSKQHLMGPFRIKQTDQNTISISDKKTQVVALSIFVGLFTFGIGGLVLYYCLSAKYKLDRLTMLAKGTVEEKTDAASKQVLSEKDKEIATPAISKVKPQIPEGAFGKAEWEKTFPVTIGEVPPLPDSIHAILEQEDPCEPGKKLKQTCKLFLRPEKVILHEEDGSEKELSLSFDGVEELAKKATNPERRTNFVTLDQLRDQLIQMQVAESGWVLIRKEVFPGSRNKHFENQKQLLKGEFEVPKIMDAILVNFITYASEGRYLYGTNPGTFTRCQDKCIDYYTIVGGFGPSGLLGFGHYDSYLDYDDIGLSGSWKF